MRKRLDRSLDFFVGYSAEVAAGVLLVCFCLIQVWEEANPIIFSDGFGYYAYLPAQFIYKDWSFDFINQYTALYYPGSEIFDFRFKIDNVYVNRHYAGVAVLLFPFFASAHILAKAGIGPADGYSMIYQLAVAIAAIFYCYVGIKASQLLMKRIGFPLRVTALSLLLILFGTNIFHYCIVEPSMSHIYSFALIALFLLCVNQVGKSANTLWPFFFLGLTIALIAITRPVNLLVILLIPFVLPEKTTTATFIKSLFYPLRNFLTATLAVLPPILVQCLFWYQQTGSWIIYSYGEFGFRWTDPQIFAVLFSFKSGLLTYSPLLLLILPGIFYFYKKNIFKGLSCTVFIVSFIYVLSSWEVWHYGMSYGMRPAVDFYSLAAILLAGTFSFFKNNVLKSSLILIALLLTVLNQVQAYQYRNYILHWIDMSYNSYKKVFLKTGKEYRSFLWNQNYSTDDSKNLLFKYDFEDASPYWSAFCNTRHSWMAHSGFWLSRTDEHSPYSLTFEKQMQHISEEAPLDANVSAHIFSKKKVIDAKLVLEVRSGENTELYHTEDISSSRDFIAGHWSEIKFDVSLPEKVLPTDILRFYLWNISGDIVLLDDVRIELQKRE